MIQLFRLTAPSEDEIRGFIRKQKDSGFSYPEVGASALAGQPGTTYTIIASSLAAVK
jgi:hypothetical protein